MAFAHEQREAARLLQMIEDGVRSIEEARFPFEEADPALVYLLFAWLRAHYHAGHPASQGVLGRIVGLCSASPTVARMAREGERDAIVRWFEETHEYRDFDRDAFIELIVEKLEG
ncbi:MAG: hypothetical protein KTR31_31450 [Myxococcales bacterium]|nr:hypothetical protein [Myxococcales bacterium]